MWQGSRLDYVAETDTHFYCMLLPSALLFCLGLFLSPIISSFIFSVLLAVKCFPLSGCYFVRTAAVLILLVANGALLALFYSLSQFSITFFGCILFYCTHTSYFLVRLVF